MAKIEIEIPEEIVNKLSKLGIKTESIPNLYYDFVRYCIDNQGFELSEITEYAENNLSYYL